MERITRFRATVLLILFIITLGFYALRLYSLQIIETDGNTDNTTYFETLTRVKAARGDILDRNGIVLVGNRASYDLVFNHFVFLSSKTPNEDLYRLVNLCKERGIEYTDRFPVTKTRPFEYTLDQYNSAWQGYFQRFLKDRGNLDSDITAPLLLEKLRVSFEIPEEWSDEEARAVIGIHYELRLRGGLTNLSNFIFIEDVSSENLSDILELNVPGLFVESSTVREYHTQYAAHVLGAMGAMTAAQWEELKKTDEYYMDALIGQTGFEAAFEEHLHGIDGMRRDTVTADGTMISQEYDKVPQAGKNVETTIDIGLQMVAEDALAKCIADLRDPTINTSGDGSDVEGCAVVVMLCDTGEILAMASNPTYDPGRYMEDYEEIIAGDFAPLFNRALMATYPPGSTFKMSTLTAAMRNGLVEVDEEIKDEGSFDKYPGFSPDCLLWSAYHFTHGTIDAVQALEVSCNYFFYELGDRLTIEQLDENSKMLGLGEPTGVELPEKIGYRANPEAKAANKVGLEATWFIGDKIQAAIGQSENSFSPLQLCVYACTLANKGVRYKATFLNRVVSSDYRELVLENKPVVVSTMDDLDDLMYQTYVNGMIEVCYGPAGTARATFSKYSEQLPHYSGPTVAGKTGTAQTGMIGSDHGAFICFVPAEDPEIAICVYGEKSAHGSSLAVVARAIIEYYFSADSVSELVTYENQLG